MFRFVEKVCYTHIHDTEQARSCVRLLRSLNLQDIQNIMEDQVKDLSFLFRPIM